MVADLHQMIARIPLPLAQLVRRALNAKSAESRHHGAYDLTEATLKLAVAARVGVYFAYGLEPETHLAERMECLARPSIGHWCELLRTTNKSLASHPKAALLPLARVAHDLSRPWPEWNGVGAMARRALSEGIVRAQVAERATRGGVIGFFEMMVGYRNRVLGHGAQRSVTFYRELADLLLAALADVLSSAALLDGLQLARPEHSEAGPRWQMLTGLGELLTDEDAAEVELGQLYLRGGASRPVSLHPLVISEDDELGHPQLGFLDY